MTKYETAAWRRAAVFFFVLVTCVGCDHASKRAAEARLARSAGLALVSGGGIGNWLDRVLHDGAVTDFVSIGLGSLRTGVFNLADLAVVAGVCLLLVSTGHAPDEPPAHAR